MSIDLKITDGLRKDEEELILERLLAYNVATLGEGGRKDLAVPLHAADGSLVGGLTGYTARGWLYISMLYVPVELRCQGLAARMLELAESEARGRGATGAYIDTMNPEALALYLRQGYQIIGRLGDLDGGHSIHWLQKRF